MPTVQTSRSRALVPVLAAFFVLADALLLSACDTGALVRQPNGDASSPDGVSLDARMDSAPIDVQRPDESFDHTTSGCVTDDDCSGTPATPHCDRAAQVCRACLPNPNTCSAGDYCDSTFTCVPGCSSDLDCASVDGGTPDDTGGESTGQRCLVAQHRCVQCLGDLDCPTALVCHLNRCAQGCSDSRPCPSGVDCCAGVCVDLLSDPTHCGSCLHGCGTDDAGLDDTCCGGICYDLQNDPRHCGTCTNRCSITNGTATCTAGACTVGTCAPGFGDCDGDATNGCETNLLSDANHCGTCPNACPAGPHTSTSCTAGICSSTCAPGFLHCSTDPTVGCEVSATTDPNNCGVCGNVCMGTNATGGCSGGACTISSCNTGYSDCNRLAGDGCEVATGTDPQNCGACFNVCPSGPYSQPLCTTGTCSVRCLTGHGDCDHMASDGCESDFSSDTSNCGACGTACASHPNSTATCSSSGCGFVCTGTFRDCNASATDGCESNVLSDLSNCGTCGQACTAAHGTASCSGGACGIASCNAGYANCDGSLANGCETPTSNDPMNCGACFHACTAPAFSTSTCASGACGFTCTAGHADCDGSATNGCEVTLANDPLHCGGCGTTCPTPAHATATCGGSACGYTCVAGFADCNGLASDGCEVNLATNNSNCGTCGMACLLGHATATCSAGSCQIATCLAGFSDCDGNPANGCETGTTADVNNCGACLNVCPTGPFATTSCVASTCTAACSAGHSDCDHNASDGCEVTVGTDPSNCGACGSPCPVPANSTATCASSACGFLCQSGFANCNGLPADGCEVNVRTSVTNCGTCGMVCTAPNATPGCSVGACTIASCTAGYMDCNGQVADGCETHTAVDSSNCGGCGVVCTGGTTCVTGACVLLNPFPSTGTEGAFSPTVNTVVTPGIHNYTTINIPAGVTVTTSGSGVLDLRATGDVTVAGTIDVSGGAGGTGARPSSGGGGGTTGAAGTGAAGIPGAAGTGGVAPVGSPSTGCTNNGLGGANGGGSGTVGVLTMGGGGGGGPAGGAGGLIGGACVAGAGGGGAPPGAGGQSGGPPYDGAPGQSGNDICGGLASGGGGGGIGSAAATDLAMATTFYGGSGGGGGSASYGTGLSGAQGGGGGGAGAVRISSPTRITVTGTIRANGGAGGNGSDAGGTGSTCTFAEAGAGGGGGSGGAIFLATPILSVSGTVNAVGGAAGHHGLYSTGGDGGAGSLGRIRISAVTASCTLTGTFNPPLHGACATANTAGYAYVASYPR